MEHHAVRRLTDSEKPGCEAILRSLPDWFGIEESIVQYARDIEELDTFGAIDGERVGGFVALKRHFDRAAELYVMAVRPTHHRRGIGRALLACAEDSLREQGVRWLQVKTLGPSRDHEPYARTRAFYRATGFEPLEEHAGLWPGNPCLVMVKRL